MDMFVPREVIQVLDGFGTIVIWPNAYKSDFFLPRTHLEYEIPGPDDMFQWFFWENLDSYTVYTFMTDHEGLQVRVGMVPNHDRIQRPKGENIDENQKF